MIMKNIGENIWIFERPFKLFGAEFGNRMTIFKLADGGLLLHSPVALDTALKDQISTFGPVTYIVTPNAFHGLFVDEWLAAFPDARHLSAKANGQNRSAPLTSVTLAELSPEIEAVQIAGIPKLNETAFFHKSSRTLILTDLAFNIDKDVSLWSRLFFSLNGAYGKFGPSRLMRSMVEDPAALKTSLLKIFEWEFEQIVISHGMVVERHGKAVMHHAFQNYLMTPSDQPRRASLRTPIKCG